MICGQKANPINRKFNIHVYLPVLGVDSSGSKCIFSGVYTV